MLLLLLTKHEKGVAIDSFIRVGDGYVVLHGRWATGKGDNVSIDEGTGG